MGDLSLYHGQGLSRRDARLVRRVTKDEDVRSTVALVRIDHEADRQAARVQAVGYVGQQALHSVAMVSALETQLREMVPAAAGRLNGIANVAALGMAQIVSDTVRKVSR